MSKKNKLRRKEAADPAGPGPAAVTGGFWLPPWIFVASFLVWAAVVYRNYLPSHPVFGSLLSGVISSFNLTAALSGVFNALLSNALNLLFFLPLVVLAYGLGGRLLSLFDVSVSAGERFIFSLGLGFGALAYLMLFLGAAGALHKSFILPAFLIASAVSAYSIRIWTFRARALGSELAEISKLGLAWKALAFLGALFLLLNIVMAFVPEIFYDSLVYHLAVPNYYLLKHRILPMSFLSHSNFPLNLSMIYTLALSLNNEILAKMVHCFMGVLTGLLIYFSVKRIYNAKAALFSAVIFCSTPIFAMNSWTCGNDVGVTFFFALAFAAYLGWLKTGGSGQFALLSVFAGIMAGTKYTAVFAVAGLALSLAIHLWRNSGPARAVKGLLLYSGTVFLFILPWFIKNYAFTGNPFQPFFYAFFGGENLKNFGGSGGSIINTPLNVFSFKLSSLLTSPWTMTLSGADSLTYIGPVFLLLLPCLLIFARMDRLVKYSLVVFCAGYAVFYLGTPLYRYILPLFVALSVCLGWAVSAVSERVKVFKLLVTAILAANLLAVFAMARGTGLDGYFAKGLSKDDFISVSQPTYPNPPYAAIDWINKNLRQDAKVFFIGESRPFYMKRDFLSYSIENNAQPLMAYLRKAKDPEDFYKTLRAENFTHLLVNYREAVRNVSYKEFDWNKKEQEIFYGFWKKHVRQEYFKEGVYVYSVLPDAGESGAADILEGLEKDGWKNDSLLRLFTGHGMWASCLEEYETYARYGYDVRKQIEYFKALLAGPGPAAGARPQGGPAGR